MSASSLADGSDPRQQWLRLLWFKVALPNLVLVVAAFFAVNWAVRLALRPLIPNFPLACAGWMLGGEFDRQIELRGLIP
jgi:hypothetical protein